MRVKGGGVGGAKVQSHKSEGMCVCVCVTYIKTGGYKEISSILADQ